MEGGVQASSTLVAVVDTMMYYIPRSELMSFISRSREFYMAVKDAVGLSSSLFEEKISVEGNAFT